MKPYYKVIHLGFLPYDVLVGVGISLPVYKKYIEKKFKIKLVPDDADSFEERGGNKRVGRTFQLATSQTILWLKDIPASPKTISVLAHEALHAIGFILDTAGVPYMFKNDEIIAYGMDFLVEEILKDFQKYGSRKSRKTK